MACGRAPKLAEDAGVDAAVIGSATLAYNTRSDDEVDAVLAAAAKAGGRIVKPAQKAFWGGWYGYFADVDGHLWEVAHNPAFPIAADGSISLPRMSHDRYDDAYISGILHSVRKIAMVGASPNEVRPSFFVMKYLLSKGFEVFPVNPGHAGKEILGRKVFAKLADIPETIDMVDIFRASSAAPGIVDEALAMQPKPKVIWMQLGVRDDAAAAKAEAAGLKVVMNRCPKIEYGRLSGEIGWTGVNSRVLSSKRPVMRAGLPEARDAQAGEYAAFAKPSSPLHLQSAASFAMNGGPPRTGFSREGFLVSARTRLQHARRPCWRQARSGDRGAGNTDLPDHVLCIR